MPPALAQRLATLAAVALLMCPLIAQQAAAPQTAKPRPQDTEVWEPVPKAVTPGASNAGAPAGWNIAFAGSRGATGDAQRTTCGQVLAPQSLGVTHPVLPCGAKVILRSGDKQVLTEVIDNALVEPGRQLEVTDALAKKLGIDGTVELQWRFATASGS